MIPRCIGIDLAWGRKNPTAVVAIELTAPARAGGPPDAWRVAGCETSLQGDDEILAFVAAYGADPRDGGIVAIDAPIRVPNETGRRPAEAECQALFGRYQAGPHPANRSLYHGDIRGEQLADALTAAGYAHDPTPPGPSDRRVIEVFPHPAHVALFHLPRTFKYKPKPGRSLESRLSEFQRYTDALRSLASADPPLLPCDPLLALPPDAASPKALKAYEDGLDALTCAYVAAYYLRWGAERVQVLGDVERGHIVVPRLGIGGA